MKVLVACPLGRGRREGDVCHVTMGELVVRRWLLDAQALPAVFTGLESLRVTSVAEVMEAHLSPGEFARSVLRARTVGGFAPLEEGPQRALLAELGRLLAFADAFPAGTVIEIDRRGTERRREYPAPHAAGGL